jgi:amidase
LGNWWGIGVRDNYPEIDSTSATILEINAAFDAGTLNSEKLVELYLDRINAYDKKEPAINAVLLLNPMAQARALDAERLEKGRRSPMHGIPVVLRGSLDTADMPTTAGSFLLRNDSRCHEYLKGACYECSSLLTGRPG